MSFYISNADYYGFYSKTLSQRPLVT